MKFIMDEEELSSFNETNDTRISLSEPHSLKMMVPLTVIYVIIFVTGFLGNIITCIVIGRNRSLRTPTNFYLFSLAISDLLLLLCGLPLDLYRLWNPLSYPLEELLCTSIGLISETSANSSVLIIAAFTVERYLAICRPFLSRNMSKSSIVRYILAIWLCALCSAMPQVMQFSIVTHEVNGQMLSACAVKEYGEHLFSIISSFLFFLVPMTLIIVLYMLVGVKLFKSRILRPIKNSSVESGELSNGTPLYRNGTSQSEVIRMLVAVAFSFFLCWAPFHVQRLIAIYGKNLEKPTDIFYKIYVVLRYLSSVFYYLSTAINPILYSIMSVKFRKAFKVTLTSWCSRRDRSRLESALLASQRQRAAVRALLRTRHPQALYRTNLNVVNEERESWLWRQGLAQGSDSLTSPHSISSSSLCEVDQELNSEELATYVYQVNCKITEETCDTSV